MDNTTAIAGLDSIQDKVRERIQVEFAGLIPKEAWDALVAAGIKDFIHRTLPDMIREQLQKQSVEKIKNALEELGSGCWSGNDQTEPGEAVKKMVKEIAPELWEIAVAGVVQRAVNGLREQLSMQRY